MSKSRNETADNGRQSMEALQRRYEQLRDRKTRADANLENAEKQLRRLQQEAREKYGTDDLTQLQGKLAEMEAANERMRSEYQQSLDKIEGELADVEARFQSPPEEK